MEFDLNKTKQEHEKEKEEVLRLVSEILGELSNKLLEFSESAAEQIFKKHIDISRKFDKTIMYNFKKDIRRVAEKEIENIMKQLEDEEIWLSVPDAHSGKTSLTDHPQVWNVVKNFGKCLWDIFKKYGYPPTPRLRLNDFLYKETELLKIEQFNKPDKLKLLCIKYWFHVSEFCKRDVKLKKHFKKETKSALDDIWNSIK